MLKLDENRFSPHVGSLSHQTFALSVVNPRHHATHGSRYVGAMRKLLPVWKGDLKREVIEMSEIAVVRGGYCFGL
jgi:hypothetical protein